eukprot:345794-Hanusia_phi.AAC.1
MPLVTPPGESDSERNFFKLTYRRLPPVALSLPPRRRAAASIAVQLTAAPKFPQGISIGMRTRPCGPAAPGPVPGPGRPPGAANEFAYPSH